MEDSQVSYSKNSQQSSQSLLDATDSPSINTTPSGHSQSRSQPKTHLLAVIAVTAAMSGLIFGLGGYYLGNQSRNPQQNKYVSNSVTASPTPELTSPTATPVVSQSADNLKTYTNQQLGISFQYPANYELLDQPSGGYDVYLFSSKAQQQAFEECLADNSPDCTLYNLAMRFILQDKGADQTLEQFYTQIGGTDLNQAQKTTIDGYPALLFAGEGAGLAHTTYIDLGEDAFEIFANAVVDDRDSMNVYRDIVKTFKINR